MTIFAKSTFRPPTHYPQNSFCQTKFLELPGSLYLISRSNGDVEILGKSTCRPSMTCPKKSQN